MIKEMAIVNTLKHFISKKLIAFVAAEIVLVSVGAIEEAKQVALGYLTAQGVVDAVKAYRKKD